MPNDGTGANWDETHPADSDLLNAGAKEIRDLRIGVDTRMSKEHIAPGNTDIGFEHKAGSAVVFVQTSAPTTRPDGVTAFSSTDLGRLWYNSSTGAMYVLTAIGPNTWTQVNATSTPPKAAVVQDQRAAGVDGGTFNAGSWTQRTLNTELSDPDNILSVASNTITLASTGGYHIHVVAPACQVDQHQARLKVVLDGVTTYFYGTTSFCNSAASNYSTSEIDVTLNLTWSSSMSITVEHLCLTTKTFFGLGYANNPINNGFGTWGSQSGNSRVEVYTTVAVTRLHS